MFNGNKIQRGWMRTPYDKMRMCLTPRNIDVIRWEDYTMVTNVGFTYKILE